MFFLLGKKEKQRETKSETGLAKSRGLRFGDFDTESRSYEV